MAFFFLLRVGEYTTDGRPRQTIPLRKQDIRLWRDGQVLNPDAPLPILLAADAITICLANQKNGIKNAVLHHTCTTDPVLDPVRSVAHLIHALHRLPPTTALGTFPAAAQTARITAHEIRAALHLGAARDHLTAQGYSLSRIGSHSLRSGGAMHLKLAGYDNDIIQKLGRWSSNTYLTYIQTQIGQLTAGVAERMTNVNLQFHLVG
jgi:hypothetical protein